MDYKLIIHVHTLIGFSALITFWIAALSKKGRKLHRLAGRAYLISIITILASIVPMIISKAKAGNTAFCVLLGYLFFIVFTASIVTWRSIQNKKAPARYYNPFLKLLASFLFLYAVAILILGILAGSFLQIVFSSVGLVLGASVWWNYWKKERPKNWFLAQHMNGVAVNFAATHGSFLRFGLAGLISLPDSPDLNTFAQTSMIVLALVLRIWLGKMYLRKAGFSRSVSFEGTTANASNIA